MTRALDFDVTVLRLGHRLVRDTRMSTHVALVSRALGAKQIIMSGADEDDTIESIRKVNDRWGGDFAVTQSKNWREILIRWMGVTVHLTMYGEDLDSALPRIRKSLSKSIEKSILVIIGAEKVPREVYTLSGFNVAIGHQPHSEVCALAIFLDRIHDGRELSGEKFQLEKFDIRNSRRKIYGDLSQPRKLRQSQIDRRIGAFNRQTEGN